MRKILLHHTIQSISIWVFLWAIYSFMYWELLNPFQFILDIPSGSFDYRCTVVLSFIMYSGVSIGARVAVKYS